MEKSQKCAQFSRSFPICKISNTYTQGNML